MDEFVSLLVAVFAIGLLGAVLTIAIFRLIARVLRDRKTRRARDRARYRKMLEEVIRAVRN